MAENLTLMTAAQMKKAVLTEFEKDFLITDGAKVYFAPGRVNLIGEHTDYNGGHVFPCALTIGTYAAARKRKDDKIRLYSMNLPESGICEYKTGDFKAGKGEWTDYPRGVMWAFDERGMKMDSGLDIVFYGNIPNGSGLSSSASLEVLTGYMLRDIYGFDVTNIDLAKIGQYSENNYNGCNCGIMDQFASAMGKKDNAIFLDTANLSYEYAPVVLEDSCIMITNSKVKHSLVTSAYNDRRSSCEKALSEFKKAGLKINALGDMTITQYEENKKVLSDDVLRMRAKHAVYENQRTIRAVEALKKNDISLFGRLMNESHISLRDDYEVSCPEIDILVDAAWKVPGVIGSRITGGGFGGCTVSIVKNSAVHEFIDYLTEAYKKHVDKVPEFYNVSVVAGPQTV